MSFTELTSDFRLSHLLIESLVYISVGMFVRECFTFCDYFRKSH